MVSFVLILSLNSFAQQLLIGDIPVSLGDSEQRTTDWFAAKGYTLDRHLTDTGELPEHAFAVRSRTKTITILGILQFQDGKLSYASKFFSEELGSAPSADLLAKTLFEQLHQLKDDGLLNRCVIDARTAPAEGSLRIPGGMSKEIRFNCVEKTMLVLISPAGKASLQLNMP